MTEEEWLRCTAPVPMLDFLDLTPGNRKLRLFACACCRQNWDDLPDNRYRTAVLVAEGLADGCLGEQEREAALLGLTQAAEDMWKVSEDVGQPLVPYNLLAEVFTARDADYCASVMAEFDMCRDDFDWRYHNAYIYRDLDDNPTTRTNSFTSLDDELRYEQAQFLRDLFGNPFQPAAFDPRWRTGDVVGLARGVYEDRVFDRLPILADALIDAGCDDEQVLGHCRGPGPHVRGCWLVDWVLGKE